MIVKNEAGREIEIEITGWRDSIEISSAIYTDSAESITEEDLDYVDTQYADDIWLHAEEWNTL